MPTSSFKQLREEERETRRQLIIDAVLKLFGEKDYSEIGMRDVAEEAGVSPASIYRYFPTRDDLFGEVLTQDFVEIASSLKKENHNASNFETLARGFINFAMKNDAKFQMMCHLMMGNGINRQVISGYRAIESNLLAIFEKAYRDAGVTENVSLRVQAELCSIIGILIVFKNYPDLTEKEKISHMLNVAMALRFPSGKQ